MGIAIEKSADVLDEIQHASERELDKRNLDRESHLLGNVRGPFVVFEMLLLESVSIAKSKSVQRD
jgi:hypothetical protein